MGAKRAVAGRSLPYDMLLAAYQKKNQAKQQSKSTGDAIRRNIYLIWLVQVAFMVTNNPTEAALDANAPLEDEDDANAGPVDSDEETAAVMSALSRWNPQPVLPPPVFAPLKRTYQLARLHEQLQTATSGGRNNIFKVVTQQNDQNIAPSVMDLDDAPGEPDIGMMGGANPRRSSSFSMQAASRRPSVASRA